MRGSVGAALRGTRHFQADEALAAPDELLVLSATSFRPEIRESRCQGLEPTPADLFQTLRGFLQIFWNLEQTSRGLEQTSQGPEQTPAARLETSRGLEPARGGRVQTSADLLQTSPGGDCEAGVG